MEEKILNGLNDVGYKGNILLTDTFKTAVEYGAKNVEYTKLVHYLTNEIRIICSIDEAVNPISSPEDAAAFIMEVTSFLKELNCPYTSLTQGHVSDRLQNVVDRLLLLDYLITELMAARISQEQKPEKKIELKLQETIEAAAMKKILVTLRFPRPPPNLTVESLFQKLVPEIENLAKKAGEELVGKPFFQGTLSEKQWKILGDTQKDLHHEYKIRREMLLTRLDVTIQSFQWSDRTMGKEAYFEKIYKENRKQLKCDPDVDISQLISSRDDVPIIEKTSCSSVRKNTGTSIQKIIIGLVPDRGGRTNELAPPPPEMPAWQQRSAGPGGRGGSNFSRGGGQNFSRGGGGGGYQNYSRGGVQQNYGRGNTNHGESATRDGQYNKSETGGSYGNQNRSFDNPNSYGGQRQSYNSGPNSKPFDSCGSYGGQSKFPSYSSSFSGKFGSSKSEESTSGSLLFGNYQNLSLSNYSSLGKSSLNSSNQSYNTNKYASNSKPFDSAGSYRRNNKNYDNTNKSTSSHSSGSYSHKRTFEIAGSNSGKGDNDDPASKSGNAFDSAGSYDYKDSKRVKNYDSFQSNKTTYSDQYAKETESNQQYNKKHDRSSRGRSNYQRGRGHNY